LYRLFLNKVCNYPGLLPYGLTQVAIDRNYTLQPGRLKNRSIHRWVEDILSDSVGWQQKDRNDQERQKVFGLRSGTHYEIPAKVTGKRYERPAQNACQP
jgi:hypothetical protein